MTTVPQVPAALTGLFPGARVTMTSIPEMGAGTAECRMENGCWSVRFDTAEFGWWTPEMLSLLLDSPLAVCHASPLACDAAGLEAEYAFSGSVGAGKQSLQSERKAHICFELFFPSALVPR